MRSLRCDGRLMRKYIYRKIENSTTSKIVTLKISVRDFAQVIMADWDSTRANFGPNRFSCVGKYKTFVTFWLNYLRFSRSHAHHVKPQDRFSRFIAQLTTCFRPRRVFLGLRQWVTSFRRICLRTSESCMAWIGYFKSKSRNYKLYYLRN